MRIVFYPLINRTIHHRFSRGNVGIVLIPAPLWEKVNVVDNDFLNFSGESLQGWGYCVFAEVVDGMDVVDKIKGVATGRSGMHQDVPKEDVIIESVTVSE